MVENRYAHNTVLCAWSMWVITCVTTWMYVQVQHHKTILKRTHQLLAPKTLKEGTPGSTFRIKIHNPSLAPQMVICICQQVHMSHACWMHCTSMHVFWSHMQSGSEKCPISPLFYTSKFCCVIFDCKEWVFLFCYYKCSRWQGSGHRQRH